MSAKTTNTIIKDGRKPISAKAKMPEMNYGDLFGSTLDLSPEDMAELDAKGLVPRWVDAKQLQENDGYHKKGWRLYRRERKTSDTINASEFKFGNDPTGVIRRGSLVLAVKTKEQAAKHRLYLNQSADRQAQVQSESASQLRSFARSHGLKTEIHEGYEENEAPGI